MGKNVIALTTTVTTAGIYIEATVPNGIGGYYSRKILYSTIENAILSVGNANKGYFTTEAELVAAFPIGDAGWFAVVGTTDTVWIWDTGGEEWVNSGTTSDVISVNGLTGAIVLNGANIPFTSTTGLSSVFLGPAIDEVNTAVQFFSKDYAVVADLTERDAISASLRKIGLKCYVVSEEAEYRLIDGIANSDWVYLPTPVTIRETLADGANTNIVVGDVTKHRIVRIEYTFVRTLLVETGRIIVTNLADTEFYRKGEFEDDTGILVSKNIDVANLRVNLSDILSLGDATDVTLVITRDLI